jgi:hypothetical protein
MFFFFNNSLISDNIALVWRNERPFVSLFSISVIIEPVELLAEDVF